jgi:hypothetical protein
MPDLKPGDNPVSMALIEGRSIFVIASEAKQSMARQAVRWIASLRSQ